MSYAIEYNSGHSRKTQLKKRKLFIKKKTHLVTLGVIAALVVLLHINAIRKWLLPGDPEVTERAVGVMVDELKSGDSLQEAFDAFCKEVISGAASD